MRRALLAAILAILGLALSAPANAYITTVTYQGTVYSQIYGTTEYSFDTEGLFGAPNTSLVGEHYYATFVVDMGGPYKYFDNETIGGQGGSIYGTPNPVLYSSITINGITQAIIPDTKSIYYWSQNRVYYDGLLVQAYGTKAELDLSAGWPPAAETPFTGVFTTPADGWGGFGFYQKSLQDSGDLGARATGLLQIESVSYYSSGSAVPEPAAWAMMIVGFGLAGAAVRKQRAASLGV
jgi:hypothetical protein